MDLSSSNLIYKVKNKRKKKGLVFFNYTGKFVDSEKYDGCFYFLQHVTKKKHQPTVFVFHALFKKKSCTFKKIGFSLLVLVCVCLCMCVYVCVVYVLVCVDLSTQVLEKDKYFFYKNVIIILLLHGNLVYKHFYGNVVIFRVFHTQAVVPFENRPEEVARELSV